jgi:hypothetical protein
MQSSGKYTFDGNIILEKSYDLICVFFASKEIARKSDLSDVNSPLAKLENIFFEKKVCRLLIEIAASLRVMSDQIKKLDSNDPVTIDYNKRLKEIDRYEFGLFDDLNLDLRKTCNKIIHADSFELLYVTGTEAHESDIAFREDMGERNIEWKHLKHMVRLTGKERKDDWHVLLNIDVFVSAVCKLLT